MKINKKFVNLADIFKNCNVNHSFFSRNGGVSKGDYASLNINQFGMDDQNSVSENINLCQNFLNANALALMKQVHGSKVEEVTDSSAIPVCDAIVTKVPNLALGVQTADCCPVLCCDPNERVIGAAHAGWRGAMLGIVRNTIKAMQQLGAKQENIVISLGPMLHKNNFEVKNDFIDFAKKTDDLALTFIEKKHDRHYFDFSSYMNKIISNLNCSAYENLNIDTYKNSDKFFSHRYAIHNNTKHGGQLSAIMLK